MPAEFLDGVEREARGGRRTQLAGESERIMIIYVLEFSFAMIYTRCLISLNIVVCIDVLAIGIASLRPNLEPIPRGSRRATLMELNISIPILISFSPLGIYPSPRAALAASWFPSASLDWNNRVSHSVKSFGINMPGRYLLVSMNFQYRR